MSITAQQKLAFGSVECTEHWVIEFLQEIPGEEARPDVSGPFFQEALKNQLDLSYLSPTTSIKFLSDTSLRSAPERESSRVTSVQCRCVNSN
jgi:hypothetical protein